MKQMAFFDTSHPDGYTFSHNVLPFLKSSLDRLLGIFGSDSSCKLPPSQQCSFVQLLWYICHYLLHSFWSKLVCRRNDSKPVVIKYMYRLSCTNFNFHLHMKFNYFNFEFTYRLSTWFAQFPASEAFSKHSLRGFPAHILPYFWLQARLRVGVQTLLTSIFVPPWLPVSKTVKHRINYHNKSIFCANIIFNVQ